MYRELRIAAHRAILKFWHDLSALRARDRRMAETGYRNWQVDCLHFASKTFKMPKNSQFTVGSIPAVSTTE
ncbi:hypothetical protein [Janthinobacterium violaceinigrum]|uniref:Uncharacterized protein n=1 Tax=Janthinobacterium violaceinigrum TaxID=2654252 RepID=A0A6I1I0F5_9BURK|nr:hypothetical protein [Janthinobacterium violaceinigrum]KAB8060478.1 hypothetical protein GCN75_24840 [Janthinobacterium violaceinigrum]